jgi:hypothetical protein
MERGNRVALRDFEGSGRMRTLVGLGLMEVERVGFVSTTAELCR